jgi:XisH protein
VSRFDAIHDTVKHALIHDGWKITDYPYTIEFHELVLFADLGAEKLFSAERGERKIVVEVKSFIHVSHVQDLKLALGQCELYNVLLRRTAPRKNSTLTAGLNLAGKTEGALTV